VSVDEIGIGVDGFLERGGRVCKFAGPGGSVTLGEEGLRRGRPVAFVCGELRERPQTFSRQHDCEHGRSRVTHTASSHQKKGYSRPSTIDAQAPIWVGTDQLAEPPDLINLVAWKLLGSRVAGV
jgi:hypothetical protein